MISVENSVPVYEINGTRAEGIKAKAEMLEVKSHWNEDDKVVLAYGDVNITVNAKDLLAAVCNATNTHRF